MKMRNLLKVLAGVFATAVLLTSHSVFAEATLPEVYQAVQAGQLAKADAMIKEVLQNHPNSAKAHYVAAEVYLKEGKVEAARNHFIKAENLAPGLPFAQAESAQKLQMQLANSAVAPVATQSSIFSNPIFWGLIAVLVVGIIMVMRRRSADAVQVYNAPTANGPYPGMPGAYPPGYPGAPAGGMGSGLMGSLATGAALGAGMYAGQALASNLMGGHDGGHANANPNLTQVGGPSSLDPNFGVNDASSWDDGASSWDDSGGGNFMDDV